MYFIYGMVNSSELIQRINYIGLTENPTERLKLHRFDQENSNSPKEEWVREVIDGGGKISLILLDGHEDFSIAQQIEQLWIVRGKELGWPLKNCSTSKPVFIPRPGFSSKPKVDLTLVRRKRVATHYKTNSSDSYQVVATALDIPNKGTVYQDVQWLVKQGILEVTKNNGVQAVRVNGNYDQFMKGE